MSIQVTLPPSPEKWIARSKSCEHPNNWCRFHLRPFILRYSPWKILKAILTSLITTNWQIWALVATLAGLPTNLAPAKVLSLTNVQHQNRWVSRPRASGLSSLYDQQWPVVVWWKVIFFGPFKATPISFPTKKCKKERHLIETHRTEGKLSATDFFCKMVSQRLLWVRFTLFFPFPTRNWYWFWYLPFNHQVE